MPGICNPAQVCLDTSLACASMVTEAGNKGGRFFSHIAALLNECAHICMGTFYAIKHHSVNIPNLALLCMGICEECAEACELTGLPQWSQCASACRYCSDMVSQLADPCPEFQT